MTDVLSTLNLHTVFPILSAADRRAHQMVLENLNDEAQNDASAPLYRKDDMLPIDDWRLQKMVVTEMMTYCQMVAMTELVLKDLRNWVYRQYGRHVMTLQICIIMLHWGIAQMADESFFLACWIQAWSKMSWVQLRANLRSATMPPRLSNLNLNEVPVLNLMVGFKVPLILCNATGQTMGQYRLKKSGDLHLYPGTFEQDPSGPTELQKVTMTQEEWAKWSILQDLEDAASVSMAELMPKDCGDLEPGEMDDQSVARSVTSQKCEEVVMDRPGMPIVGNMNLMVNFQLLDYERRHDPCEGDVTFQGFSYGLPTFLPK